AIFVADCPHECVSCFINNLRRGKSGCRADADDHIPGTTSCLEPMRCTRLKGSMGRAGCRGCAGLKGSMGRAGCRGCAGLMGSAGPMVKDARETTRAPPPGEPG